MGWGEPPTGEAAELLDVQQRAKLSQFERRLLDVLGDIRDALQKQAEPSPTRSATSCSGVERSSCSCGRDMFATNDGWLHCDDLSVAWLHCEPPPIIPTP